MLVISTVNSHGRMGSGEGWLHELPNQQALVSQVSAFSYTVNRPEELAPALARAFAVFDSARPRPGPHRAADQCHAGTMPTISRCRRKSRRLPRAPRRSGGN